MSAWRVVKYLLLGTALLGCLLLLIVALGFGQLILSTRPHTRMTSRSPDGAATVTMIENHKLADIGVRMILERGASEKELLYGEDCWPQFIHFTWSLDGNRVVVVWRDGLCRHTERPILKAWSLVADEEIPVDEDLREVVGQDILKKYFRGRPTSPAEALDWALAGTDNEAWRRLNPEPFWVCLWC